MIEMNGKNIERISENLIAKLMHTDIQNVLHRKHPQYPVQL